MKLFLASSFDIVSDIFVKKLGRKSNGLKVLFVENAADNYKDKWWVEADKKAFEKHGFVIEKLDLRKINSSQLKNKLEYASIFHVCGGSVLHLLNLLQEKQMIKTIYDAVKNEKLIYTGSSAGSMIVASDLTLSKYDEEEKEFVDKVSDYRGIGLVNFYIIPHSQNKEFLPTIKPVIDQLPNNKVPILLLNDNHALWIENEKIEILSDI